MVNPNRFYTYAYLREDRTPYYIGKGGRDRIYSTNRKINQPKDKSRIIYLKQNLTEAEAFKHEVYMIAVFGRIDLGTGILYNMTDGGEGTSGAIRSEEFRRKISEARKGKTSNRKGVILSEETRRKISEAMKNPSEETRKKISEASKGNTNMLGKTHSEETKRKMREASKGRISNRKGSIHSEETRKKISEALKGKTLSEESKRKVSEASKGNTNMLGKTHSEETKRKQSEAKKGRKCWNDGCGNCKMVVECPGEGWRLGRK